MGIIFSRFRRKLKTTEVLERLEKDIRTIEDYGLSTQRTQRRIVGHFILMSIGVYVVCAIILYFYFFPETFYDRMFYVFPLLVAPLGILSIKRFLSWYFDRKISNNQKKLLKLQEEKKKMLEQVMDTETYTVAKGILEKYAPDHLKRAHGTEITTPVPVSQSLTSPIRQRAWSFGSASLPSTPAKTAPTISTISRPMQPSIVRAAIMSPNPKIGTSLSAQESKPQNLPMVRNILARDRGVVERLVEYLVGDGPSNRYALICKNCKSHNGMALKEEFEYISFRCCYCYAFNPARKLRPSAPKLAFDRPATPAIKPDDGDRSTSESEKNSNSDNSDDDDDKKATNESTESVRKTEEEKKTE